jgi:hypothetical protein
MLSGCIPAGELQQDSASKSIHTRLVHIVSEKRNYGTYGISGIDGKDPLVSVVSVNSVCSVVSLLCKGIATALIEKLKEIAVERRAYVIFVQADTGVEDQPAKER